MAELVNVGKLTDFPEWETKKVDLNGRSVVIVNTPSKVFAFLNYCTHAGADMSTAFVSNKFEAVCLLHDSVFDLETGKNTEGPAGEPIPVFEVRVEGEDVLVDPVERPRPR